MSRLLSLSGGTADWARRRGVNTDVTQFMQSVVRQPGLEAAAALILFERLVSFPLISPMCFPRWPHASAFTVAVNALAHMLLRLSILCFGGTNILLSRKRAVPLRDLEHARLTVPTRWQMKNIVLEQEHSPRSQAHAHQQLTHKRKHAFCDAVPQAGRPLHLPHLLCPKLNFDQSFQRQRLVYVNCVCKSVCVYAFMQSKTSCFS